MKFSATAVLAVAAGAYALDNVTITTEIVTAFTTYCPDATTFSFKSSTYTVTEATTLTITHCPGGCTVTKPLPSASPGLCSTCGGPPIYTNGTASARATAASIPTTAQTTAAFTSVAASTVVPVGPASTTNAYTSKASDSASASASASATASTVTTAGTRKLAALSGAGLAGILCITALLL